MTIDKIESLLVELYDFRKNYFLIHAIEEASLKEDRIKAKVQQIVAAVSEVRSEACKYCSGAAGGGGDSLTREQLANLCWAEGKARNATSEFDPVCQEMLTKALKLNPDLGNSSDIHVQLGECFWKKLDREGAKLSFEQSLKSSNPEIIKQGKRNLSILMRQVAAATKDREEHLQYMDRSIKLVKEAIQLDFSDGVSWYILGNAHFSQFFVDGQKPETMKLALQAYKNAFKDQLSHYNCDLLYNYGVLLKFQEKYSEALSALQLAAKLDPLWTGARDQAKDLELVLQKLTELAGANGGLKQKQFDKIMSKFDSSHLEPYKDSFKDSSGKAVELKLCNINDLEVVDNSTTSSTGNEDRVCLVKVIAEVGEYCDQPPYYCIVADSSSSVCVVSVFNAAKTFHLQRGDSLAIAQPLLTNHNFELEPLFDSNGQPRSNCSVRINFKLIRINTPLDLVVNGKKMNKGAQVFASVGVEAKAS